MERNDNNNRSEDASKGDVCEISDGVVTKESCVDKQKVGNTRNEESKEKIVRNGKVTVANGNDLGKTVHGNVGNSENKIDIPKSPVREKTFSTDEEQIKSGATESPVVNRTPDYKIMNENITSSDSKIKATNPDKNNVVVIQKPKRTKSRKSLNRMYSVNNIGVDINGNATIPRTDSKMFSWLSRAPEVKQECYENVVEGLKSIYKNKMFPLEQHYLFHDFHSPPLQDADFDAKPMILLVGQYSTGKTTFIKYLLEREFPGMRIGPEPTTDRFIAVMFGENEGVVPGNALVVDPKKQFRPLSSFGNAFLNRFQCSMVKSTVLKGMSIIDTPGILSGEKQRIDRGYDFTGVLEWFAERVDRIILLFDAHKLDISDEFRRSIEALRGHDDKIRIVLNKADMIDHQQLMRVYGALMWSLGKVLQTPEVVRVYIGSFWDEPLRYDVNRKLFEAETQDLFKDLQSLPKNSALRKLNDLIKRARLAKVHAFIISEIKNQLPMFGRDSKKKDLVKNLSQIYEKLMKEHSISTGDFPDINKMKEMLTKQDVSKFHSLKPKLLEVVNEMLSNDISQLMAMIPHDSSPTTNQEVTGGAFANVENDNATPFGFKSGEGCNAGYGEPEWIVNKERNNYDELFEALNPIQGKLSGQTVKEELVKSKLPNVILAKIWKLSDVDKDGYLDKDEFALAMHLINVKLKGNEIPEELPQHLVPPAKKERLYLH